MKKLLLSIFALSALVASINAQDAAKAVAQSAQTEAAKIIETTKAEEPEKKESNWKISGIITFNASATGLVNWAAGGNNNINMVAAANVSFLYKNGPFAWDSNIDTDFGESYVENSNHAWQKTNDKLNISTKFGWEMAKSWYLTALGSFKTQYAFGYDYSQEELSPISQIMTPSYTDLSVGIDWKPNSIFTVYVSPIAGRITTATNADLRAKYFGADYVEKHLDPLTGLCDRNYQAEFGASLKAGVNYDKIENLKIISTVTVFTPYSAKPHVDLDWDFSISYQFLKVLNVSLGTQLKYYDRVLFDKVDPETKAPILNTDGTVAQGPRVQFKTILGLGIGYSF
ncbi:MAG: DUF3078 domain-containing protein [Paludibacteraceae bacterium]|nr:DUF3078 domain-containing protein [Paludibacteraceae bacterium]